MLRRLFRLATAGALGRAWAQRSSKWLSIAGAILLLRLFDSRSANQAKTAKAARKSAKT